MAKKPGVLIPFKNRVEVDDSLPEWKRLEEHVDFIKYKITTKEDFKVALAQSNVECLWITEDLFTYLGSPAEFYDDYSSSLKLIAVPWVGTDFLDGPKLKREKGIVVCNIGPSAASNVGELALFLALSCFRMTSFFEHCFRFVHRGQPGQCAEYVGGKKHALTASSATGGEHHYPFPEKFTREQAQVVDLSKNYTIAGKTIASPNGKTALILGFGYIGQSIGKKLCYGLDMKIQYFKRSGPVSKDILGYPAKYCSTLEDPETWVSADLIVLALPGHSSTQNVINAKTLSMCKDQVRIVNVGRGSCIDEDALFQALESGKVASAGLDVFKNESTKVDERFFDRWDVTLLPHIGSTVSDMVGRQTLVTLQNVEDVLVKNGRGLYPCN